jgi:type I restriction enzyme, R subunit
MVSNKERIFEDHICNYFENNNKFIRTDDKEIDDRINHFATKDILTFIKETQSEKFGKLGESYGDDSDDEILKALKKEIEHKPLWLILRDGFEVRGINFALFTPKPRSKNAKDQLLGYKKNVIRFKQQYHFNKNDNNKSIDIVLFLNGVPIITIELKHEDEGQNYNDAIDQYVKRNKQNLIFKHPFLHIAMDTSDVMVATDASTETNFQWFNGDLVNEASTEGEYPVEYMYSDALTKDRILEYLEFYLIYVPEVRKNTVVEKEAFTIFPRYHQLRSANKLANSLTKHYDKESKLGRKYLISHSAGSGKTLTIAWMADRLHSLYKSDGDNKMIDMIFVLTDRRSLDKNLRDDFDKFKHLEKVACIAKKSSNLAEYIKKRKRIIVTTIQKFAYIYEKIQDDKELSKLNIAYLIDEAHRSQEGKMAGKMRATFTKSDTQDKDVEETSVEDIISKKFEKIDISNQVFVAFTATPTNKTVSLFGRPADIYSENEAIQEKYILDVASNVISYKTLYNLKSEILVPKDEFYPAGVVSKALREIAYRDEELIQYKSEVIINYFQREVAHLLDNKAKAMVVASSRPSGLIYFNTLKSIVAERNLPYQILFAFSDYTDENDKLWTEDNVNELTIKHEGKVIEDVFDEDDLFKIIVVANKFQTGFDQPKLVAMFLDKQVKDMNAVQTLSRLNRKHIGKEGTVTIDFTNNVKDIFKAFQKYRGGDPFLESEPSPDVLTQIYNAVLQYKIFSKKEISDYVNLIKEVLRDSKKDANLMDLTSKYKLKFLKKTKESDERKDFIKLLNRYVSTYYFVTKFYKLDSDLEMFLLFSEMIHDKLIKEGNQNGLKQYLKGIKLEKGAVVYKGKYSLMSGEEGKQIKPQQKAPVNSKLPVATIPDVLEKIKEKYPISDKDAIVIREICEEQIKDSDNLRLIENNLERILFLQAYKKGTLRTRIIGAFYDRNIEDRLGEELYIEDGGILDLMTVNVIEKIRYSFLLRNNISSKV